MLSTLAWLTFIADLHNYHSFYSAPGYLTLSYIKQPLGNLERQLLHMSYSHTQHTWVFILTPIFSVIILIQATPRKPRAAIASRVLLTYPAHLGIHSHAYLLCHYSNSSNPSGAPSGNCFTCLTHIPSTRTWVFILTPIFSVIILIQATPRDPRAAIASRVLLTYPSHLGILPHA